ncbi:hypothetical protein PoB_004791000 [Plakobranchus ocellatus]|uniref:Uncharacterized protein n=1 Tax=Plakobranchus ocellatus TaxID=259542 RepID=A0AAV4BQM5_9GAST|nr:hypothetical protein PoB_004791000 [Plakobranchus ocellatus]
MEPTGQQASRIKEKALNTRRNDQEAETKKSGSSKRELQKITLNRGEWKAASGDPCPRKAFSSTIANLSLLLNHSKSQPSPQSAQISAFSSISLNLSLLLNQIKSQPPSSFSSNRNGCYRARFTKARGRNRRCQILIPLGRSVSRLEMIFSPTKQY